MTTVYLDPKMVPAALRSGYTGTKFKARVCESMTIPATAGLWDGGSRDTYTVIRFEDGAQVEPLRNQSPWNGARQDIPVKLEPGIAVVEHTMFCGKDMGLTFYVHPDNAAKLLPAPVAELSDHEKLVLGATASFKSSYGGKDRYEMCRDNSRHYGTMHVQPTFPTRDQWETAKQALISRGLLNKAGAITVAGRNAVPSRY